MTRLAAALTVAALSFPLLNVPAALAAETCTADHTVNVGHIIRSGHQDIHVLAGNDVVVRDEGTDRTSGSFSIAVPDTTLRAGGPAPLGAAFHAIDQAQTAGVPWLGFSTEDISTPATFSFASVQGPGRVLAWHTKLSTTIDFLLDSADPASAYTLAAGRHDHVNWAFTQPGAYRIVMKVETDTTAEIEFFALVGDKTINDAANGQVSIPCSSQRLPDEGPERLAAEINDIGREFTALDKQWGTFNRHIDEILSASTSTSTAQPTPTQRAAAKNTIPPSAQPTTSTPAPQGNPPRETMRGAAGPSRVAKKTENTSAKNTAAKRSAAAAAQATKRDSTPTPAPSVLQQAGSPPAQPASIEAAQAGGWRSQNWWAGLSTGIGITTFIGGVALLAFARRLLPSS
ncbi:choice-of-anchor M domain-containing protein [Corynebacterium mayonis]|uniref:choice-of-anchor M domain-containing protein n=1 Tax=Corynebacterium mayonis TaxID=3062461 RepID=UPI0031400111